MVHTVLIAWLFNLVIIFIYVHNFTIMNVFNEIYFKTIAENEHNLKVWENHLQNLCDLDFTEYSDRLKVPALIPIGNRILFRGEIKHTNEVTVALGQGYFVKCSVAQAEIIKQRRIKDAEAKVKLFKKEKELLENRLYYSNQTLEDDEAQEIIEHYNEDEDKIWREKHKQQIKEQKKKERDIERANNTEKEITIEDLFTRLEELELQEELENETQKLSNEVKEKRHIDMLTNDIYKMNIDQLKEDTHHHQDADYIAIDLLQKVLIKQQELEHKLNELKHLDRPNSKTESDLINKLEEMEQFEEFEDEIDRLDDIIDDSENKNSRDSSETDSTAVPKVKRSVSFADDDDCETMEITFEHTDVKPNTDKYDPGKGIIKPSDIYEAFPNLFGREATNSILKKSKYSDDKLNLDNRKPSVQWEDSPISDLPESSTIVVKDIAEKSEKAAVKESKARPTSLFKQKRQKMKSFK